MRSRTSPASDEQAIFGGEVTGHYYFRNNFYADNGFIPALLILELMSRKGQTAELLAPLRQKYFISGEINTRVSDIAIVPRKLEALAAHPGYAAAAGPIRSTASPPSSPTGTSTSGARTRSPISA